MSTKKQKASNAPVISGMGVVSAAGCGVQASLKSMEAGERNFAPVSLFESPIQVPVFEFKALPPRSTPGKMRTLELLEMALDEALQTAQLSETKGMRIGIAIGTSVACQLNDLDFYSTFREKKSAPMDSVDGFLEGNLAEAIARQTRHKRADACDRQCVFLRNRCDWSCSKLVKRRTVRHRNRWRRRRDESHSTCRI